MIASHLIGRDNDQQNHWVQWGFLTYFQTHPYKNSHLESFIDDFPINTSIYKGYDYIKPHGRRVTGGLLGSEWQSGAAALGVWSTVELAGPAALGKATGDVFMEVFMALAPEHVGKNKFQWII